MGAVLVFGPVGRVAERFAAAGKLAHVRLLAGVRPEMRLEILEPRVRFGAALELRWTEKSRVKRFAQRNDANEWVVYRALVRFLAGVPTHVNDEHVLCFEWFFIARTLTPSADETLLIGVNVVVVDVFDEIVLGGKFLVTVAPVAVRLDEISRFVLHRVT